MDSRLPVLKASKINAFIPSDRMKLAGSALSSTTNQNEKNVNFKGIGPVGGGNTMNVNRNFNRPKSPELVKRMMESQNKYKMRRSRSACDVRFVNNENLYSNINIKPLSGHLKRTAANEQHIPAKVMRSASAESNNPKTNTINKPVTTNLRRNFNKNNIKNTITTNMVSSSSTLSVISENPTTSNQDSATTKPKTNTTNKTPSANAVLAELDAKIGKSKRIPAYDYKARFLDLQEKFFYLKNKFEQVVNDLDNYAEISEQNEKLDNELKITSDKLLEAYDKNENLERQHCTDTIKIQALTTSLQQTNLELKTIETKYNSLKTIYDKETIELTELRDRSGHLISENNEMKIELGKCKNLLFRCNIERKELHNTVLDLKGNIRVFCRVRPVISNEDHRALCGWQYIDESSLEIISNDAINKNRVKHDFSFDQVFHPHSTQLDIFEMVSPLIQSALDGFNICIFAYGQTGSGKTYTMDGVYNNIGIIPRTVDLLFESIENYKTLGWQYEIRCNFLEIYNEVLYDLLDNSTKEMEIRMVNAKNPTDIYVSNIVELTVDTPERLRELMAIAKSNRATATTVGNERSSRSHSVTKIQLIGQHIEKKETCIGTINLVDLAGSESPKTSQRMDETKKINKSLSELTNVILALLQKHDHIPYRNSKLTHLLMPCLGGNSKTLMFINVAPFQDCFTESVKSLRFAANVNACKLNKVKRNKFLNASTGSMNLSENQSTTNSSVLSHSNLV